LIIVVLASALVIIGAALLLRPLLLRLSHRQAQRLDSQPFPPQWLSLLDRFVPATRHLSDAARLKLLRSARELIRTRHWEGARGLVLTEEVQLVIAAQACLLTLALPGEPFPGIREILVYPRTFVPRQARDPRKWLQASEPRRTQPLEGESWGNGVLVLAWDAVLEAARDPADGSNVVLHEFAHELDYERHLTAGLELSRIGDGAANMTPSVADPDEWRRVLQASYERLCGKIDADVPSALDDYGATNIAEFFAVATETFFEQPAELAREEPELYAQLRDLYRQDPGQTRP
jgi:Mlc titration factor MtfA (ptsG expression regulator)